MSNRVHLLLAFGPLGRDGGGVDRAGGREGGREKGKEEGRDGERRHMTVGTGGRGDGGREGGENVPDMDLPTSSWRSDRSNAAQAGRVDGGEGAPLLVVGPVSHHLWEGGREDGREEG